MFQIIICSAGRARILREQTLRMLAHGHTTSPIHIIVPIGEVGQYRDVLGDYPCHLYESPKGLTKQRQFARNMFPADARLLFVDDDIQRLRELRHGKLYDVENFDEVVGQCFDLAGPAHLWGVYPVANRGWQSEKIERDSAFCVGAFYGIVNDIPLEPAEDLAEDWARQLHLLDTGGHTVRYCKWGVQTKYFNGDTGGIQGRTRERMEVVYRALGEKYSHRVTLIERSGGRFNFRYKRQSPCRRTRLPSQPVQDAPAVPESSPSS